MAASYAYIYLFLVLAVAIFSTAAAIVFGINGLIRAMIALHYLRNHPEEDQKNKRKIIISLILNILALIPLLAALIWTILSLAHVI